MAPDALRRPSLRADEVAAGLRETALPLQVEVLEEVDSTNAELARRARQGAPEGLVVVAESQTAGRGRLDRTWQAPPRSALLLSLLLRPEVPPADWPWLPLLVGRTVATALRGQGHPAGVKWPNDVLVEDRKLAGILVERVETPSGPAAVVGIGLNVAARRDELPVQTATSLSAEAGRPVDRAATLVAVLEALATAYDDWRATPAGRERLAATYAADCVTVGREVRVELPGGQTLLGRATGVDRDGRLVVAGPQGPVAVGAGDVVHVRAVTPTPHP